MASALIILLAMLLAQPASAALSDSLRVKTAFSAWGPLPAPSDSTRARFLPPPRPLWVQAVEPPYQLVKLPFRLLRLGTEHSILIYDRLDLRGLLGPYPLPGGLLAELEAGDLGGLGLGIDIKDDQGGDAVRAALRFSLAGAAETRLGLRLGGGPAHLVLSGGYSHRPDQVVYGLGPETPEGNRATYTQELGWGGLALESPPLASAVAELALIASTLDCLDRPGARLDDLPGGDGTRSRGLGLGLRLLRDSTDQDGRPARGGVVDLKALRFFEYGGGLADFWHLRASLEHFVGLWNSDQTLALRGVMSWIEAQGTGEVAFTRLLGNENPDHQRGYPAGRWRDRGLALATAEYRWPIWAYLSPGDTGLDALLFSDVGQVFPFLDQLGEALKTTWGGGLRLIGGGGAFTGSLVVSRADEGTRVSLQFDQRFQYAKGGLFHGRENSVLH